jgi:exoribonuclease R
MDKYTFHVDYRDYTQYSFEPKYSIDNPLTHKLFDEDIVQFENDILSIFHSPTRISQNIPGILLLENNKTYGRTENKKRLFYKCRPNNTKLPHFLVPYDIPMGFNKNFKNKYITIRFDSWTEKHPRGIISQNLGDVYDFPSFCEYSLYCKSLHNSITKSITKCKNKMKEIDLNVVRNTILESPEVYGPILDRTEDPIFSIDPCGCLDRDDALSITIMGNNVYKVSVYIANVWLWIQVFDLWDTIGDRVSTIYLPNIKRPMLPIIIGEHLCSLDKQQLRFGFVLDFYIHSDTIHTELLVNSQYKPTINQCLLNVYANFDYEEPLLFSDKNYELLFKLTSRLDKNVKDSHEVVAFWMTQMNNYSAKILREHKIGIFRTVQSKNPHQQPNIEGLPSFVKIIEQQIKGQYVLYNDNINYQHEMLGLSEYVHFTSPIRRMVDLLNQIQWIIQVVKPPQLLNPIVHFFETQTNDIESLNKNMKNIRKLQQDCEILYRFINDPQLTENTYEGIIISNSDKKTAVYIEEFKWLAYIPYNESYVKYRKIACKLYMFEKEEQMKRKIRIQIIS